MGVKLQFCVITASSLRHVGSATSHSVEFQPDISELTCSAGMSRDREGTCYHIQFLGVCKLHTLLNNGDSVLDFAGAFGGSSVGNNHCIRSLTSVTTLSAARLTFPLYRFCRK